MDFDIAGKVALITGGASGIGLSIAEALLNNRIRGVVIADINEELGTQVSTQLIKKYGFPRVMFVKTDVSDYKSLEHAFKETVKRFNHIDILFNNAGIVNEVSYEKCIDVNLKGPINGMVLAMEYYLKQYKKEEKAVIVNTCSVAALGQFPMSPIYSATKSGIFGLTKCYGDQFYYDVSGVKTIAICPGATLTPLYECVISKGITNRILRPISADLVNSVVDSFKTQSPDFLAKETLQLVERAPSGSVWVIEENLPAYEFALPNKDIYKENTLKHKF